MTTEQAAEWLRTKGREFRTLDRKILDTQHRAAVYTGRHPEGSAERAAGRVQVQRLGALLRSHQTALNRWDALGERLPFLLPSGGALGLIPLVPLALAGTVVALATSMALIFRRVSAEERAVRLLEDGTISAAEAIALTRGIEGGGGLFALPSWAPLALLAAGGFWLYRRAA